MKQLPIEILVEIFLYLHPKNKIDCMLVCQHWKRVIKEFALYQALIIQPETNLKALTGIVKESPNIGKKVEHLKISIFDRDTCALLLLLPNIRKLISVSSGDEDEYEDIFITEEITKSWSRHIEYISEYTFYSLMANLLLSNMCSKLTTINLDYSPDNIISLLKNAPSLKNLRLSTVSISFDGLETLHEYTPCLESFTVQSLKLEESVLSNNIKPAISITDCHFKDVEVTSRNLETTRGLLKYASKKYPNISSFTYTFYSDDDIKKIKYSDWLPLLQNLGPKLKKLSFSTTGWADNTFDILDRCNCQIEYLRICRLSSTASMKIFQSQQIYCIQTLVLCDINFETFSWLNKLQTLKKLKLYYSRVTVRPGIRLDLILDNSPLTLRSLSLCKVHLDADPKYTGLSSIDCLSFNTANLPAGIDTFISQHFPKLTNLKLKSCYRKEQTFNLEKTNLLNFTYRALINAYEIKNLLIVTSNNNERRWYLLAFHEIYSFEADNKNCTFYPSTESQLQTGIDRDIEADLIFLCNSLNHCILI